MAAHGGPVPVDRAATGGRVVVAAVAVGLVADHIGESEIPLHLPRLHLGWREGETQLAADGVTDRHPLRAVDLDGRRRLLALDAEGDARPADLRRRRRPILLDIRGRVAGRRLRPDVRLHLDIIEIEIVLDEHPPRTQDADEFGQVCLSIGQAGHERVENRLGEVAPAHHLTLELVERTLGRLRPVYCR